MSCLTGRCHQIAKTYVSSQEPKARCRLACRVLLATVVLPTLMFAGCMTHPGDRYVVQERDWETIERHDPQLGRVVTTKELPLEFVGHTQQPNELITLQAWVPDENVVDQQDLYREPLILNSKDDAIYFGGPCRSCDVPDDDVNDAINNRINKWGRHIPGRWTTIGRARTNFKESMPGWYSWIKQVQFRPEGDDWGTTFLTGNNSNSDLLFRFDFRALGDDGRPLGCWKKGFSQYFDFGSDAIEQYPAQMADVPERMSVYYPRRRLW